MKRTFISQITIKLLSRKCIVIEGKLNESLNKIEWSLEKRINDKKISRCLISVSDKTDLDKLLKVIKKYEIEIISTGGTYEFIKSKKYDCIEISKFTSFPEILDGRVKTFTS